MKQFNVKKNKAQYIISYRITKINISNYCRRYVYVMTWEVKVHPHSYTLSVRQTLLPYYQKQDGIITIETREADIATNNDIK